jgi:hypothetical protein
MGTYDSIDCKYPLPLPKDCEELKDFNFNGLRFQTKDFDCGLELYEIREDGTVWRFEFETIIDESKPSDKWGPAYKRVNEHWDQLCHFTGTINFYDFIQFDTYNNDYWIEYEATFNNGQLIDIKLSKFSTTNNEQRKSTHKNFIKAMKMREILWDKWYMKYGYKYYDNTIRSIFNGWRKWSSKWPSSHQIEQWLRPL